MVSFSAENITGKTPIGASDYEKAEYLHDQLLATAVYRAKTTDELASGFKGNAYTAYGALVENEAVDEGYALAFKKLCDLIHIECRIVRGNLNGVSHVWNMILLDDNCWYHVDCSADDMGEAPVKKFFALNDKTLAETHTWQRGSYPECVGETYLPKLTDASSQTEPQAGSPKE
jgi:transglutaminase/protease-like cytokinesis protein 3